MSFFRRWFGSKAPAAPAPASKAEGRIDVEPLGIEFTHLPPAPDLSYHVMGAETRRLGLLLVSEAGRKLPFLGIWVEDGGGLWQTPEGMQRILASAPIQIPDGATLAELMVQPSVMLLPLANAQVGHRVLLMRKRRSTVFFILEDWLQAFVAPGKNPGEPGSSTVLVAVGSEGDKRALVVPKWWRLSFEDDWESAVRGGQPATPWEDANELWEIRRPRDLQAAVKSLESKADDESLLPAHSGGLEAVRELAKFLQFGDALGTRFFYTSV